MSRTKKADHRLVNPNDSDYEQMEDGSRVLIGPYSLAQRQNYIDLHVSLAETRFPKITHKQAKDSAFHKWRNVVIASIQDRAKENHASDQ